MAAPSTTRLAHSLAAARESIPTVAMIGHSRTRTASDSTVGRGGWTRTMICSGRIIAKQ